jgi:hypothetical protein
MRYAPLPFAPTPNPLPVDNPRASGIGLHNPAMSRSAAQGHGRIQLGGQGSGERRRNRAAGLPDRVRYRV